METFIHIRSPKFRVLDGENEELVNPGMYGKHLCQYLQEAFRSLGYSVPGFNPEDWGWWIDVENAPVHLRLQVYGMVNPDGDLEHAITHDVSRGRSFALRPSKRIDRTPHVERFEADLTSVFEADPEIEIVGVTREFPFG